MSHGSSLFEAFLNRHDDGDWSRTIQSLEAAIHPVDRTATTIWFHFFPVSLARALRRTEDREKLLGELKLQGNFDLKDQIDASHRFLYGHRYWPSVKRAATALAESSNPPASLALGDYILDVSERVATEHGVDRSLLAGITAVALMTLQQVGLDALKASSGEIHLSPRALSRTPAQILAERARDDKQGFFAFLQPDKIWTVTFDESEEGASFKLINTQQLTTAAANDKRDHRLTNPRCVPGEGPIPVECRSASCGTCWVGVLGGAEKLSEVTSQERRRIKEFGYIDTDDLKPVIRLACVSQAFGAVSIVIPPWNGVMGRLHRPEPHDREAETLR